MASFTEDFRETVKRAPESLLESMSESNFLAFIREASERTGTHTIRRRKIPVESVIWLVVGMAVLTDVSIRDVFYRLGLYTDETGKRRRVASSATTKARMRVGAAVFRELFGLLATYWERLLEEVTPRWCGLRTYAIDGTTQSVPDSSDNRAFYGGPSNQYGEVGYPQARVMVLLNLGLRLAVDAAMAPYSGKGSGEQSLLRGMSLRLPDHSVLLFDCGLMNAAEMWSLQSHGEERHWIGRVKENRAFDVIEEFDEGDVLARLPVDSKARRKDPTLPKTYLVRVLTRPLEDGTVVRMMTSLLDPELYTSEQLWTLYEARWGIETSYRESKTIMHHASEPLRSRTPECVEQEQWGHLIAYNMVRFRMARASVHADVPPTRISFKRSIIMLRAFLYIAGSIPPSKLPRLLNEIDDELSQLLVEERPRGRSFPRENKRRGNRYPQKRPRKREEALK